MTTACSVTVARSRSISSRAAAIAAWSPVWPGRPGTDAVNASNAPSLATRQMCTTVERSDPTLGRVPLRRLPGQHLQVQLVLLARRQPPTASPRTARIHSDAVQPLLSNLLDR